MRERSDGQPMKIYCGTDLVEITRMQGILERQKDAFISRCFTEEEITYCEGKRTDAARAASFAARFAAKEAFGKAVGTGVLADGIGMKDEWGLDPSEATLKRKKKRHFLALGIAAASFILILTGIFYILPRILPGFFAGTNIELFVQPVVNLEYEDDSYRVVIESSVSLMSKPEPSSVRITEVLYNDYLVIRITSKNIFTSPKGELEGKFIFIFDNDLGEMIKLPPTEENSFAFLYFKDGLSGTIQPVGNISSLNSYASGTIKSINVEESAYVTAGEILIELDTQSLDISIVKHNSVTFN